jgi:hypothetical protein
MSALLTRVTFDFQRRSTRLRDGLRGRRLNVAYAIDHAATRWIACALCAALVIAILFN